MVILGRSANGEVLLSGGGDFGHSDSNEFEVPSEIEDVSDEEPIIGEGQISLTIVIQLDSYPRENGWRIDRLGLEVEEILRVPAGIYTVPQTKVTRTVVLEEGELYYFRVYDILEDGIDGGYGKSFLVTFSVFLCFRAQRHSFVQKYNCSLAPPILVTEAVCSLNQMATSRQVSITRSSPALIMNLRPLPLWMETRSLLWS